MRYIKTLESFGYDNLSIDDIKNRLYVPDKDLANIIDRLVSYEDDGYSVRIDICYYDIINNKSTGKDWYDTKDLVFKRYQTSNDGAQYTDSIFDIDKARLKMIDQAFKEDRICYRISFSKNHEYVYDLEDKYDDIVSKLKRFEVIGPEYIAAEMCFILIKCNL